MILQCGHTIYLLSILLRWNRGDPIKFFIVLDSFLFQGEEGAAEACSVAEPLSSLIQVVPA